MSLLFIALFAVSWTRRRWEVESRELDKSLDLQTLGSTGRDSVGERNPILSRPKLGHSDRAPFLCLHPTCQRRFLSLSWKPWFAELGELCILSSPSIGFQVRREGLPQLDLGSKRRHDAPLIWSLEDLRGEETSVRSLLIFKIRSNSP